ncbi:MAG: hypothetical protein LBR31_04890 [Desulfovibrio sp.]|jgi:hypothetical protein|nr:hypothetical protein [Desulfovibrio sp.]
MDKQQPTTVAGRAIVAQNADLGKLERLKGQIGKLQARIRERERKLQVMTTKAEKKTRDRNLIELGAAFASKFWPTITEDAKKRWKEFLLQGLEGKAMSRRAEALAFLDGDSAPK